MIGYTTSLARVLPKGQAFGRGGEFIRLGFYSASDFWMAFFRSLRAFQIE